jgi:protein-S-isoprenylcysteine O-methyltransferase Ste14
VKTRSPRPVVKIQKERAHTVIISGPYRYVRHPMYADMIFYFFCAPLLLAQLPHSGFFWVRFFEGYSPAKPLFYSIVI